MGTHRVTIDLPEHAYQSLRTLVGSGQYDSESDVISEALAMLRLDPVQDQETTLKNWMLEEVLPAVDEFDADPSSGLTSEQLRIHLAQARQTWTSSGS